MTREGIFYWKCDRPLDAEAKLRAYAAGHYEGDVLREAQGIVEAFAGIALPPLVPLAIDGNHGAFRFAHGGRDYVLRCDDGRGDDDYLLAESAAMTLLRRRGLPVPAVHATDVSRERHPLRYQIIDFCPQPPLLEHLRAGRLDEPAMASQMAAFLAELHRCELPGFGFIDTRLLADGDGLHGCLARWSDYFDTCLERHTAYLRDHAVLPVATLDRMVAIFSRERGLLDIDRGVLLHRDFAWWNILGTPDRIAAVIDWDDAVIGDPADDLGIVACFCEPAFFKRLLAAYRLRHPVDEALHARIALSTLRNMAWKMVIRHELGYFNRDSGFFLSALGGDGSLREQSLDVIDRALGVFT
ncbi:MAG: phosphotransferase family protein [Planctomycetota bacterium]